MKIAYSGQGAATGAVAGILAGFVLSALGLGDILGNVGTSGLVSGGLLGGALIGALKRERVVMVIDAVLVLVYFVVAFTPIMRVAAERWVRSDPIPASADAIVVLSAGVKSDGGLNAEGVERLLSGIQLYQRGVATRLFTTKVEQQYARQVHSSTPDQERLLKIGNALAGWTVLDGVFTTHDEALQSAAKLPTSARSLVVVTSPMHTRRACAAFEAVGFRVTCFAAREHHYVTWYPITPKDRLAAFRAYAYERLGMVKYRTKGWLPAKP